MKQWKVKDVMTTEVVSVVCGTPYSEVVHTLAERAINAVPVLDVAGRVAGVVSEADLLRKVEFTGDHGDHIFEWGTRRTNRAKAHAATAKDLMTSPAVTVEPGVSVVEAAKRLESGHIKQLPVVDEAGRLVGIVARRDLLKMYLRPDAELRREIVDGVLRRLLWMDPVTVKVSVAGGIVRLTGEMDRKSTVDLAVGVTRQVPGVVEVIDELTWSYDDTTAALVAGF